MTNGRQKSPTADAGPVSGSRFDAVEWLGLCSTEIRKIYARRDITHGEIVTIATVMASAVAGSGDDKVRLTIDELAARCRCEVEIAAKAIQRLEEAGFVTPLKVVRHGPAGEAARATVACRLTMPATGDCRAIGVGERGVSE